MDNLNDAIQPDSPDATTQKKRGRSTTGCANCKLRKIKCDERKPACTRCCDRRLSCPGYPSNHFKWSSKHEVRPKPSSKQSTKSRPISRAERSNAAFPSQIPTRFIPSSRTDEATISPPSWQSTWAGTADLQDQITNAPVTSVSWPLAVDLIQNSLQYEDETPVTSAESPIYFPWDHSDRQSTSAEISAHSHVDQSWNSLNHGVEDHYCIFDTESFHLSASPHETYLIGTPADHELSTLPPRTLTAAPSAAHLDNTLYPNLLHIPTVLIEYYFKNVSRECSTFDSPLNPFRSMVAEMQVSSASMNHVIQSLAATKLANDIPRMKVTGIEAQGLALQSLKNHIGSVTALQDVSNDALCAILLLGMTTSWHVREDLGVQYLTLAQRIVMAKMKTSDSAAKSNLEFYVNALKYWTMIVSLVSSEVINFAADEGNHFSVNDLALPSEDVSTSKIMPHPWTGVSPVSQHLFGRVLRLIRETRDHVHKQSSTKYSRAGISNISRAISEAENLEDRCWSIAIPSAGNVEDTRDTQTPPVHHTLTAKAYLLSALLHIYAIFPDVLSSRINRISHSISATHNPEVHDPSEMHKISPTYLWPQRSTEDPHEMWLRDIGLRIVESLESIDVKSSTRVVHPPILLSVASALTLSGSELSTSNSQIVEYLDPSETRSLQQGSASPKRQNVADLNAHVKISRSFIISRLETMHAIMRFHAIENVLRVVKEVWNRADAGVQDYFWMDVMHELRCETLFG